MNLKMKLPVAFTGETLNVKSPKKEKELKDAYYNNYR